MGPMYPRVLVGLEEAGHDERGGIGRRHDRSEHEEVLTVLFVIQVRSFTVSMLLIVVDVWAWLK